MASTLLSRLLSRFVFRLTPDKYKLRARLAIHNWLEDSEPELRSLHHIVSSRGSAIDVGANVGYYAIALSAIVCKVHAFEINPLTSRLLKASKCPNIQIYDYGVSDSARKCTLYTPISPLGYSLDGWASLVPGNCPWASRHKELQVEVKPLDCFGISDCSFIKIDVEGHELEVLKGAKETISLGKPRILIEVKSGNVPMVKEFLANLGYRQRSLVEICGVVGSPQNMIFDYES